MSNFAEHCREEAFACFWNCDTQRWYRLAFLLTFICCYNLFPAFTRIESAFMKCCLETWQGILVGIVVGEYKCLSLCEKWLEAYFSWALHLNVLIQESLYHWFHFGRYRTTVDCQSLVLQIQLGKMIHFDISQ